MRFFTYLALVLLPAPLFAAPTTFRGLLQVLIDIMNTLIPLIFALTFIVFVWGIVKAWILGAGDTTSIEDGKQIAVWGIVGMVVMVSIWGIVALLRSSLF